MAMFTATTTKKHLFTVIPAKTKQCHFVRICANVYGNCVNFMLNVNILRCTLTKNFKNSTESKLTLKQNNQRKKKNNNTLVFWSAVTGYCIARLQSFQCLIFVAVCHSVASFSTSVLHFSQSLHVGNVISQCFNKSNSLFEISRLFLLSRLCFSCWLLYFLTRFMLRSCCFFSLIKLFQQWRIWNAMMAQQTDHTSCQRHCCPSSRSPMRGRKQWTKEKRED